MEMGGAGEAGVVEPDTMLDTIEQPFRQPVSPDMPPGDIGDGAVHGAAVVAGGHDQVDAGQQSVPVNPVVVNKCPARGLGHTDTFGIVHPPRARTCGSQMAGSSSNRLMRSTAYCISIRRAWWLPRTDEDSGPVLQEEQPCLFSLREHP